MILVDTSVWIDHFRRTDSALGRWLAAQQVLGHPFVQGELACGHLRERDEVLGLFDWLPRALVLDHASVLRFVEKAQVAGSGLGWVDVHLLACSVVSKADLATRDQRLARVARTLGLTVR